MNKQDNGLNTNPEKTKQTRTHVRSPYLFPAYDFSFARQISERVERDGAGSLSEETLAINMHLSVTSSGFQLKALTARQFGLLTKHGQTLSTTPLAKAIFKPMSESEKKYALVQSFLSIPLFREVATRFKGRPLPQSQDFRNILEREFKIDSRRVSDAERVLMDSARDTGVLITSGSSTYISTESSIVERSTVQDATSETEQVLPSQRLISQKPDNRSIPIQSGGILTISEDDLAKIDDEEFDEVWGVLGKIMRRRVKPQSMGEKKINIEDDTKTIDEK